jgi:hypothetical protein
LIVCYPQFVIIYFHTQVDIPASAHCVQSLVEASLGLSEHEWEVGWSLASHNNDSQSSKANFQTQVTLFVIHKRAFFFRHELVYFMNLYVERYPYSTKTLEA